MWIYAESEVIVRSFHSCQDKPVAIEEVPAHLARAFGFVAGTAKVLIFGKGWRPGTTSVGPR